MLALLLLPSCSLFADDQDTLPVCELPLRSIDESGSAASGARADVGRWIEYGQPNTLNIEGPCTNGTAVLARGAITPAE